MTWKNKFTLPRKIKSTEEIKEGDLIAILEQNSVYLGVAVCTPCNNNIMAYWGVDKLYSQKRRLSISIYCKMELTLKDKTYLLSRNNIAKRQKIHMDIDVNDLIHIE